MDTDSSDGALALDRVIVRAGQAADVEDETVINDVYGLRIQLLGADGVEIGKPVEAWEHESGEGYVWHG